VRAIRIQPVAASAIFAAFVFSCPALAQAPAGYPATYQSVIDAAKKEGSVTIYSTTDSAAAAPLLKDFQAAFPGIKVEYSDLNSTELYSRFISEMAAGATGDLMWSSAPDLQVKLVADGNGLEYASPEIASLPSWAVWKNQAYGTTYEPMAIIYNKRLVPAEDVPQTHKDFTKLLNEKTDKYKGKVTAYDPERSGVGFLMVTRDVKADPASWDLFKAFGKSQIKLYTSAGAMMERVASGEHLIGYNIFSSYAVLRAKKDPNVAYILPKDFTLIATRVAFISKKARHPNAAKVFLDYLLSKRGQDIIAQNDLGAIRADVEGDQTAKKIGAELGDKARPVPVSDELLTYLEEAKRLEFLKEWQQAMQTK